MKLNTTTLRTAIALLFVAAFTAQAFAQSNWSLAHFYSDNEVLDTRVNALYTQLSTEQRVAQMIVTSAGKLGKADSTVIRLALEQKIGGVVFLKGDRMSHKILINKLNLISYNQNAVPLLFSMDAEPSLLNGRISDSQSMVNTIDINNAAACDSLVKIINQELRSIGVHQNYAPVCDLSASNEAITNRSFGTNPEKVIELSAQFITSSQEGNIVATAKHFPGHGLVKGDTHKQSVYIDGELQELSIYPPLIDADVISIMVAHITVLNNKKYNTDGLPATCSRKIVTDLLREEMSFEGIIISDALNIMKAVTILDKAPLLASKAGCDHILMPIDEAETMNWILEELKADAEYAKQVEASVKRILRMKVCLGML
ncbi:MAG: beta-N-acetylhexosaminidase [Flavobacteriales bacterium]|jgi:beta-N-acetylhexosaminidase